MFCAATEASVRDFQKARGLRVDGRCDADTWAGLVEASWQLGDRLLFLTAPNLRGDDVADLQTRLGRIGFDCGRVDGILGPDTARALHDFQSNCGLVADGTCGPVTLQAIERVSRQTGSGPGVATVRERDRLRMTSSSLRGLRVVIGQFGGLGTLTRAMTRDLRLCGAIVMSVDEPDARAQAAAANNFGAHVYIGWESHPDEPSRIAFYSVPAFESAGGRSLAGRLAADLADIVGIDPVPQGMRLQVLRETRMPGVLISVGAVRLMADRTREVTLRVRDALEAWAGKPLSEPLGAPSDH
jgi:N-acetylmuramoyl-L-alanine amidase